MKKMVGRRLVVAEASIYQENAGLTLGCEASDAREDGLKGHLHSNQPYFLLTVLDQLFIDRVMS